MKGKAWLAPVAAALCVLAVTPALAQTVSDDLPVTVGDASQAAVDTSWYLDDPGEEEYQISTAAQLRGLAALVNGTAVDDGGQPVGAVDFADTLIYQTATVNLSEAVYEKGEVSGYTVYEWTPIGTAEHPFAGTFSSLGGSVVNGLYITETYSDAGLFGSCAKGSLLSGVGVRAAGGAEITLTTQTARISDVGSVVGYTAGDVTGCYSDLTITIASTGAGIATVDEPLALCRVGGVAGYVTGNLSSTGFGGLLDVLVASNVPAASTDSDSLRVADCVGGVVGRFGEPTNHGTITGCYNEGTVYTRTTGDGGSDRFGTSTYARIFYVGGIVGYSNGSIYQCKNGTFNALKGTATGTVSTSSIDGPDGTPLNNRGAEMAGGICGGLRAQSDDPEKYNDGDPDDPMEVANCSNAGHVTGTVAIGGIVGQAGVYCTITCCYNGQPDDSTQVAGKVISTRWNKPISAGVLGESCGCNVTYCANYAEVRNIQTGYYMAGICGALFTSDDYPEVTPEIYACLNTGGIYTINESSGQDFREAGICGSNEGYIHDCLNMEGSVRYHKDAIIGDDNWGMWSNLETWTKSQLCTGSAAAYLNAMAAQEQDWSCYWFCYDSGLPTLNQWTVLSEEQRVELTGGEGGNVSSVTCVAEAPYVGGEGGSLPTLEVTLADGTKLAQDADFYVVAQPGAVDISTGGAYRASIVGLGMYRGMLADCASYDIGSCDLSLANMVVDSQIYNGGRVILPTAIKVRMGKSAISPENYSYVIYSRHVSNDSVQKGQTGCTLVFDSLGYISYAEDGSDKVAVSTVGITAINAETRAYWLWDRNGEKISDSTGAVYYTNTSGGGTAGRVYSADDSCTCQRTGSPAGYVVVATALDGAESVTGSVMGNYTIDPIDMYKECDFAGVTVAGETWYWDDENQQLYAVDAQGVRIQGLPAATFTGKAISPAADISCVLADGSSYQMTEGSDFKVVCGDPDVTETYQNRNVTDYSADPKVRACATYSPIDTKCFHNYIVAYFAIAPADFADCEVSLVADTWAYTGQAVEPQVVVTLNGVELIEGVDYTVTYANNVEKGTASYTVTPLANLAGGSMQPYAGSFTIQDGFDLSALTIDEISDQQYNYGYDVHPTLTFRDAQGQVVELSEGTDYTVSYSTTNVTKATGTNPDGKSIAWQAASRCKATITGRGLYVGTQEREFDIVPYDATANATKQLRATIQQMKAKDWKNGNSLPYNVGLTNPVVNVYALPIVDWAAYEAGDYDAAYGSPIVIGNSANAKNGATMNNRPARYYVLDEAAPGGLGDLVSCDGEAIENPYETGSGTSLATKVAPADTPLVATVAMRVGTSGSVRNGAVGLLRTETFQVASETPQPSGTYTVGDINNNGKINIVDAQIASDLGNGVYGASFEAFPLPQDWNIATLKAAADVNASGTVDALDARAIQIKALQ